jgi:RecB family exonuclease
MTRIAAKNFDAQFPINIDLPLDTDFSSAANAGEALQRLKAVLPYTFRFEGNGRARPHPDLSESAISVSSAKPTARELLKHVVASLPAGWQATGLRSHLLLYKEHNDLYPDAEVLARS